jgi:hypothetical protein
MTIMPNGKPNILVIWGDDIGISNLSCYTHGLMGYQTPNIDRIAKEGMMFTDSYGEQSCTAGRSSFITGQSVYRTGLSKVGIPGAPVGMNDKLVTIAALLKEQGYATGQFGKNHLGDLNHMLPTNHGFDEFFGNLYHLNAEEEPEMYDYYPDEGLPQLQEEERSARRHPFLGHRRRRSHRAGALGQGRQAEDRGHRPADRQADGDLRRRVRRARHRLHQAPAGDDKPFFVWLNTTHMHMFTHTKPESLGQAGRWQSPYHDTMIDHDKNVGQMLDLLDELGLAEDTIVIYSTDNGPHRNSWPDGGMTPFRSEKDTNWEGAFRIPELIRWPGKIAGRQHLQRDRPAPRLAADLPGHGRRAGHRREGQEGRHRRRPGLQEPHRRLQPAALPDRRGRREPAQAVRLHQRRRRHPGAALRQLEGRVHGAALQGHAAGLGRAVHAAALPKIFNLRTDPYEFADITSNSYYEWLLYHAYILYGAYGIADQFAATFKDFPPVQKPNTFTIDDALAKMAEATGAERRAWRSAAPCWPSSFCWPPPWWARPWRPIGTCPAKR